MKRFKKASIIFLMFMLLSVIAMPVSSSAAKLNKKSISLNVGKTYTLKATETKGKITWTSSKKSVATVSSKGVIKARKKGTTIITAKYGKKKLTCKVTVKQPVKIITLNKKTVSVTVGKKITLKATALPQTANNKTVTWKSSNTSVATISSKGIVVGKKAGTVTITATAKDGSKKKASCKVTVKTAVPKPNTPSDDSTVITTAKQLFDVLKSSSSTKIYQLGKDIDVSGYSKTIESFRGTLDGNGHKIINLKQSLLKQNDGTIKNVIFDSCGPMSRFSTS